VTDGEVFVREVDERYQLSAHEQRLVRLAGEALDRALAAGAEFARHVADSGSVLLGDKPHPASIVARDSARAFELLTRAASLPADAVADASIRRLREVRHS
jgi:hypothetical protein